MKTTMLAAMMLLFGARSALAQNFAATQQAQEAMIRKAYKRGRVTPNEYHKLMDEQQKIKQAMWKYKRDGILTPRERDAIDGKLARAEGRLARYKHNWER